MPDPLHIRRLLARYQFVWWWPEIKIDWGWNCRLFRTKPRDAMFIVYEWFFQVGPLQIRKWVDDADWEARAEMQRKSRQQDA